LNCSSRFPNYHGSALDFYGNFTKRFASVFPQWKPGTPHFGNHTDKWEDGSVSETSGVVDSDRRSFISDGMSTPLSISRAYVHSHSDDDDLDEDLPRRSEDLSEEYCREVQCIETEESVTVYNNKKDKRAEPENVLGCGEDANGETSVSQNVRVRSWNRRETVSGPSTPPENIGTGFLGRPESHKIAFPDLEFGSTVSRNDSMSSCGSDSTGTQSIRTPLGEEGGITSIRTFVEGLKEMAKRQGEVSS